LNVVIIIHASRIAAFFFIGNDMIVITIIIIVIKLQMCIQLQRVALLVVCLVGWDRFPNAGL
jgi:hypothetical protein